MKSLELSAVRVNVDLENESVIVTGVDVDEIVSQIGYEELLNAMEYADVMEYVAQAERDKAEEDS